MPQVDKDGFILVRHKNSAGPPSSLVSKGVAPPVDLKPESIDVSSVISKIERLRDRLCSSAYLSRFLSAVDAGLAAQGARQPDLVCFGLGHVATAAAAQHQLALLELLRQHLQAARCECYDPVFWPEEAAALRRLGVEVLTRDEQCARRLSRPTLLYMPHCETEHYDNLLRANWHPDLLPHCLLVGNSLSSVALRLPPAHLRRFPFVERAAAHGSEISVGDGIADPALLSAFNDTAVQWFAAARLRALPAYFWDERTPLGDAPADDSSDDGGRGKPRRRRRKKSRSHH